MSRSLTDSSTQRWNDTLRWKEPSGGMLKLTTGATELSRQAGAITKSAGLTEAAALA